MITEEEIIYGLTGFIDILGFGKKVTSSNNIDDINSIIGKLEKVQEEFEYKVDDDELKGVHEILNKTVLAFSDCVVLNVPFTSEALDFTGTYDGIMAQFLGIAIAQYRCITKSIFIRGGLDYGWWYNKDSIIVSNSLVKAYKKEGKAIVPIIALTENLYEKLLNHPERDNYKQDADPFLYYFEKHKNENFYFINYLEICLGEVGYDSGNGEAEKIRNSNSPEERNRIRQAGYKRQTENCLKFHSQQIKEAFNEATSKKVKNKYRWLSSYHNSKAKIYSDNLECRCNLEQNG